MHTQNERYLQRSRSLPAICRLHLRCPPTRTQLVAVLRVHVILLQQDARRTQTLEQTPAAMRTNSKRGQRRVCEYMHSCARHESMKKKISHTQTYDEHCERG